MTTLALNRFVSGGFGVGGLLGLAAAFIEVVREGREVATRYERLRRMSDRDLARRGLTRMDIPRVAVNGIAGL